MRIFQSTHRRRSRWTCTNEPLPQIRAVSPFSRNISHSVMDVSLIPMYHVQARWPSGLRRCVQARFATPRHNIAVSLRRGFESHSCHTFSTLGQLWRCNISFASFAGPLESTGNKLSFHPFLFRYFLIFPTCRLTI